MEYDGPGYLKIIYGQSNSTKNADFALMNERKNSHWELLLLKSE